MENIKILQVRRDESIIRRSPWGDILPGRNASGYGDKISLPYQVLTSADNRWRRVYCRCWSNCGINYILVGGREIPVDLAF